MHSKLTNKPTCGPCHASACAAGHDHDVYKLSSQVTTSVRATPSLWLGNWLNKGLPAGSTCISHPEAKYGSHAPPVGTTGTLLFTLTNSTGSPVVSVCPQQTYTLQVWETPSTARLCSCCWTPWQPLCACQTETRSRLSVRESAAVIITLLMRMLIKPVHFYPRFADRSTLVRSATCS